MVVRELQAPVGTGDAAGVSPEYVRISMASAIALRMHSGRFSRDFDFGGINVLLNYQEACRSDCGYCGLARERPGGHADRSFIRVEWPLVRTDELVTRLARFEPALTRLCISMVTHGLAYRDTCDITRRITARIGTPISVLVAPPTIKRERLENLKTLGVDMIGVGLDAVTEDLFWRIRTDVAAGGLSWDKYWEVIGDAREIFGAWKVNIHTLVGLGETDKDLLALFVALRDRQIFSYLFCFNPEPDSRLAAWPQPPLARWHRVQLARHLIEARGFGLEQFDFDDEGRIARIRAARSVLDAVVAEGTAFMTDGCPSGNGGPGCTRPYGSYRPAEPFRDYPFAPTPGDLEGIRRLLGLDDLIN
jgi:biotin synthase